MLIGEVGLNHLGDENYANTYIDFHFNNQFEALTFQIREHDFYKRPEKKHLKLKYQYYYGLTQKYKNLDKKIGLSICDLDTLIKFSKLEFDFYKILSIAATDKNLIKNLLNKTTSDIYISCGLLNKKDFSKLINFYSNEKRIKFIYTQLSYNISNQNLINLFNLSKKHKNLICYGHHYTNNLPIILASSNPEISQFIYLKGNKKLKHPDEKHSLTFNNFKKIINNKNKIIELIGKKDKFFSKNNIPDQRKK
tara:strand:- start:249 stop:1001 length:753 start_codon:yes stop_codon:yes gene_type:complete